jgi:hypothetical protein
VLGCDVVGLGGELVWGRLRKYGRDWGFAYGGCGAEGGEREDKG